MNNNPSNHNFSKEILKEIVEKHKKVPRSLLNSEEIRNFLINFFSEKFNGEIINKIKTNQLLYSYIHNEDPLCSNKKVKSFESFKKGYNRFCNQNPNICDCLKQYLDSKKSEIVEKRNKTLILKYGTTKLLSLKEIRDKKEKTTKEKYGFNHHMKNEEIKNKLKKTNMEKYGVDNISKLNEIKQKVKKTKIEKYGFVSSFSWSDVKEKIKQTLSKKKLEGTLKWHKQTRDLNFQKYGISFIPQKHHNLEKLVELTNREIFEQKIEELKNYKYLSEYFGVDRETIRNYAKKYNLLNKIELVKFSSYEEKEVVQFLESIYKGPILTNVKNIIYPYELDIFVPDKNFAIEYCGLYWHSEFSGGKNKYYHFEKYLKCKEKGIKLLTIFSDEWVNKKEIVKNIILNNLIDNRERIFARKTEIVENLNLNDVENFYENNHIQGYTFSKINLGLVYNNDLVSLISFNKKRICSGNKILKDGEYEIVRYCSKIRIVGGFEKLLKFFIKKYSPKLIYTFTDNRYFSGQSLLRAKFEKSDREKIDFWFVDPSYEYRIHRYRFRKQILIEKFSDLVENIKNKSEIKILRELGYDRIWGCGKQKWSLKIE